jgi:hypothetical protein
MASVQQAELELFSGEEGALVQILFFFYSAGGLKALLALLITSKIRIDTFSGQRVRPFSHTNASST